MNAKDIIQLRQNSFAVSADGHIETRREPDARWSATHLAVLRIDAPKEFTNKVLSALDEPAAIVGVSPTSTVALFKVIDGGRYDRATYEHFRKEQHEDFVLNGKTQGLFTVTSAAQTIDPAGFVWKDGRSPITTHRDQLPQLFRDTQERFYAELERLLKEGGHRTGPLVVPETAFEKSVREIAEKRAAGIVETPVDEDERTVAANPDLRPDDGIFGVIVSEARKRIAARKAAATP
jgi:hypothetical protein